MGDRRQWKNVYFYLNSDLTFSDHTKVTSKEIGYRFSNVKVDTTDPAKMIFHLNDAYSPFLVTVSRPIFKKGYIGIGDYKLSSIHLNGNFVESLSITSNKE